MSTIIGLVSTFRLPLQAEKVWGQKVPSKCKSGGEKRHYISNCGGTLTTTYHIQGAGAPAKTENYVNADAFIFFREKVRPFPHLAKPVNTTNFMLAWK